MGGGKGRAIGRSVGGMALLAMLLGVLLLCLPGGRSDAAPAARTYVGVASCAGSTCHGRMEGDGKVVRSEEHTSELQSLMRISYAVFCLKKKKTKAYHKQNSMTSKTRK